ncbi:MAG: hypothetical protein JNM17_13915 [Archangium sp.]|nr:hypothetical protein [Archangium sp.]
MIRSHVAAIARAPDDDTLRRVCADELSAAGNPRGEFITLSLMPAPTKSQQAQRELLLSEHGGKWLAPLLELGAQSFHSKIDGVPFFERGFVAAAGLFGRSVENVSALLEREPIVKLRLTSGGVGPFRKAARAPELAQLRTLVLDGRHIEGSEDVLAAPLPLLEELVLRRTLEAIDAQAWASGTARPLIASFGVENLGSGVRPLGTSGALARVQVLSVRHVNEASVVAMAPGLGEGLHTLTLDEPDLTEAAMRALHPRLRGLSTFRCTSFPSAQQQRALDSSCIAYLIDAFSGGKLRVLDLQGMRAANWGALLNAPAMRNVVELNLGHGALSLDAARAISRSVHLGSLRVLDVRQTYDDEALGALRLPPSVQIERHRTEPWD